MTFFSEPLSQIKAWKGIKISGKVSQMIGLLIESTGPQACLNEICYIRGKKGEMTPCEVIGFREERVLLMPLNEVTSIFTGAEVIPTGEVFDIAVGDALLGRVINSLGQPIDGKGPIFTKKRCRVSSTPPNPMERSIIKEKMVTGVKAIDALCTIGKGQRMGIFSGSGVGKSTLLAMITRNSESQVNVLAMIGERGREVKEFIEHHLGEEGMKRTCVVVATSDQAALIRAKGAGVATTIAEYFQNQGHDVILMMDSITRYAMALREIGLARGEPPTAKGYTPAVFSELPRLLERSGCFSRGSITGIYTILVEGDDMDDPIADHTRSILDGHLVLSRKLASNQHFPPIDIGQSLSRVMPSIVDEKHAARSNKIRELLYHYQSIEELFAIGAYVKGQDAKTDQAIASISLIRQLLQQRVQKKVSFEETTQLMTWVD